MTLPEKAHGEQSKAQFQNGLLTITVPQAEPARAKSVKIPISAEAKPVDSTTRR